MFCSSAARYYARRLLKKDVPALKDIASKTMEISPPIERRNRQTIILSNQLEKVVNVCETTTFDYEVNERLSSKLVTHRGSYAYLIENATLVDGMLFAGRGFGKHLLPSVKHNVLHNLTVEEETSALYSSLFGGTYWGHWLKDDCSTYLAAKEFGVPVSIDRTPFEQQSAYEYLLGMGRGSKNSVFFKKLWVFDDCAQNSSRVQRYQEMRKKILSAIGMAQPSSHMGVYISRGQSGHRRLLLNEEQVCQFFLERGFKVVDTMNYSVPEIVKACAGARVVAGVEGSSLSHGFMMQNEGDGMLVLNPPNRFNNIYKDVCDSKGMNYATIVGDLQGEDFTINLDELAGTLDLLQAA